MNVATTGSSAVTVTILPNGEARLSSSDPWYRFFRALADLYLAGEIELEDLSEMETRWTMRFNSDLNEPAIVLREFACPAARELVSLIGLTCIEPECLCDPYKDNPCSCPPADHRDTLRQRIGA